MHNQTSTLLILGGLILAPSIACDSSQTSSPFGLTAETESERNKVTRDDEPLTESEYPEDTTPPTIDCDSVLTEEDIQEVCGFSPHLAINMIGDRTVESFSKNTCSRSLSDSASKRPGYATPHIIWTAADLGNSAGKEFSEWKSEGAKPLSGVGTEATRTVKSDNSIEIRAWQGNYGFHLIMTPTACSEKGLLTLARLVAQRLQSGPQK